MDITRIYGNKCPEKVLKERKRNDGKSEYYIKWKRYPREYYSWELRENLDCDLVIRAYEEKCRYRKEMEEKAREEACRSGYQPRGILRNFEPRKILGMSQVKGEWHYLIQWESEYIEYVATDIIDKKWPDMVMHFADTRLSYDSDTD